MLEKFQTMFKTSDIKGEALPEEERKTSKVKNFFIGLLIGFIFVLFLNYFVASFLSFLAEISRLKDGGRSFNFLAMSQVDFNRVFSILNVFKLYTFKLLLPYIVIIFLIGFLAMSKMSFGSKSQIAYGQKGDSQFTTLKQLKEQYKSIPDKPKDYPGFMSFKGIGGIPISHYKNNYFIDTDTVNSLVAGTSRSGKGELIVTPFIDILSRAEIQCSIVANDTKGELYAASADVLKARGYDVQVLDIMDPTQSMSYNPLQLVKEAWLEGNHEEAAKRANSIAFSLYHDPNAGENAFFNETAQSAVTAIILSLVEFCVTHHCPEKITMGNVAHLLNELGTTNWVENPKMPEKNALDEWFKSLPQGHVAKKRYGATNFAGSKTRGSILSTANNGLQPFVDPLFVKMTSRSSIDLKQIGFPKYLKGQLPERLLNQRIEISFIKNGKPLRLIKKYHQKIKAKGFFSLNFDEFDSGAVDPNFALRTGDFLRIVTPKDEKNRQSELLYRLQFQPKRDDKGNIIKQIINGEEKIEYKRQVKLIPLPVDHPIDPLQQPLELYYSNRPTAVFMIIPDYDSSNHTLASIFVKQLYTTLAQNASETKGNKTFKRVQFILDEFGNMPAIDDMDQIMTVSLGRNILFNLFVQSFSQLTNKYGENIAEVIKENSQNWIYIMSLNSKTIEAFVQQAGSKTDVGFSTNGQSYMSLSKNLSKDKEENDLITFTRLKQLLEGETLVIRSLHRKDLRGHKVRPYPIFNTRETRMPYRWEFLSDWIDTRKSLNEIDIPSEHAFLDLADITIDATEFIVNDSERRRIRERNHLSNFSASYQDDKRVALKKTIQDNINWILNQIDQAIGSAQEDITLQEELEGLYEVKRMVTKIKQNKDYDDIFAIKENSRVANDDRIKAYLTTISRCIDQLSTTQKEGVNN